MDSQTIKVLAIPGSLRNDSYNKALLEEASRLAPEGVDIEVYRDGQSIPPYNQDMDGDLSPAPVLDLRARIREADAVLVASPEYNGSITGVLKNLIDWASRPYGQSALNGQTGLCSRRQRVTFRGQVGPGTDNYGARQRRSKGGGRPSPRCRSAKDHRCRWKSNGSRRSEDCSKRWWPSCAPRPDPRPRSDRCSLSGA